jgi:hypothetical protein
MPNYQRIESADAVFGKVVKVNEDITKGKLLKDEMWSYRENVQVEWKKENGDDICDDHIEYQL